MPDRILTEKDDRISIKEWLDKNISDENSLIPKNQSVPELLKKGIYFWFLKKEGLEKINASLDSIKLNEIYQKTFKEDHYLEYDLVYLGTAGTGRNEKSNLKERLKWHIEGSHNENSICSGFLSTLRTGIGSILSDDLIEKNTEDLVNDFFKKYFKISWIEYDEQEGIKKIIDNDERYLIKSLKPLLNLKNNPNAKLDSLENPTKKYKKTRNNVIKSTKLRIECETKKKYKEDSEIMKNSCTYNDKQNYDDQIIDPNENGNFVYEVYSYQDIAEVTRGIFGLPSDKVKIAIFYLNKNVKDIFDCGWNFRKTSNIYNYFSNDNTNSTNVKKKRSTIIKELMEKKNIDTIIVQVWPDKKTH